ncbi:MAG: hypothetical protein ACLUG4_05490 [Bacilli bacterium]|jgi:hypothetical protein|nr:hypothetical protein [Staphylococcus sp.]
MEKSVNKIHKIIRILTVAPFMAIVTLSLLLIFKAEIYPNIWYYLLSLFFLGFLPLLAYPLQKFIPFFKNEGRNGQRNLAIIFAVAGYILGCIIGLFASYTKGLWLIYLEYLLSGLGIAIVNQFFHLKISGHACGIIGPIMLFVYFKLYIIAIIGLLIGVAVYISSIKMKRHTIYQLLGGSLVPIIVIFVLMLILN